MTEPEISQEMIRIYDEYTHLTLDRRGFMDRLTRLAGSAAAAAAIAPLIAANSAKAAIVAPDDGRVVAEEVTFPGGEGSMSGYLAMPAKAEGKPPAVVVIHENRGLNPHIEDVTRRLALEGFVAMAPDFLSPLGGTPADEDKARDLFAKLKMPKVAVNAVAAAAYLRKDQRTNGKVGVVGFCWGGGVANQLAVHDPRPRCRGRLLRTAAGRRRCAENQGEADAALCRPRRAHQRRHSRLRESAEIGWRSVPSLHL